MSEFSMSRKSGLPSFLLSDFFHLCFFVLSHPLYFSYFIFFSPYLFKIFSFLSPLFITTTLLLVAFLSTVSPSLVQDDSSEPQLGSLAAIYQTVSEKLRSKAEDNDDDEDEEFQGFEEFEVYKIVFESSDFETREDPFQVLEEVVKETCSEASEPLFDKCLIHENNDNAVDHDISKEVNSEDKNSDEIKEFEKPMVGPVETLKWCLQEEREWENMSRIKEDKEDTQVKPWNQNDNIVESEKVDHQDQKQELFTRTGSKLITGGKPKCLSRVSSQEYYFTSPDHDFDRQYSWKSTNTEDSQAYDSSLGSFGSMRKEKEWRRTLACKLFEERHNADGGEGMDMLWETYETSESNKAPQSRSNSKKGKNRGGHVEHSDVADEDDEYEDEAEGQLCCLQALKFSAGKMNLGMGRPNLVKISKALKGFGWITHVGRHGKKRYH